MTHFVFAGEWQTVFATFLSGTVFAWTTAATLLTCVGFLGMLAWTTTLAFVFIIFVFVIITLITRIIFFSMTGHTIFVTDFAAFVRGCFFFKESFVLQQFIYLACGDIELVGHLLNGFFWFHFITFLLIKSII